MAHLNIVCLMALAVCVASVHSAIRVARSPQFGGFSQASAQAQAGGFGGPRPGFGGAGFGPRPPIFGRPGFGGPGLSRPGGSINISKSISISTGGGSAQSSAGSNGFGK